MIEDLPYIQIHPDAMYSSFFDDTTPYYEAEENKITRDQYDAMEQLDREPLNEEEIKIIRQILPSHIPATKLNLKNYVYERESAMHNNLSNTYRLQKSLGDEFKRLRDNGYRPLVESLEEILKNIMPIKAEVRYYFEIDQAYGHILNDVKEKIKELKI